MFESLKALNREVQAYVNTAHKNGEWEMAYDLVFNDRISRKVFALCDELGSYLDYYDPDTSYEEDVCAFANALNEKVAKLETFLDRVDCDSATNR